jgi:site-specific recombinase XerD
LSGGKTGEWDAIVRSVAAKRLDKYLTKRRAEEPGGLLFAMPDGSQIISLIDQLEAGIERSSFGEKYSAYSLRHFYAVNALRNGVGVFEVARTFNTTGSRPPPLSLRPAWVIDRNNRYGRAFL